MSLAHDIDIATDGGSGVSKPGPKSISVLKKTTETHDARVANHQTALLLKKLIPAETELPLAKHRDKLGESEAQSQAADSGARPAANAPASASDLSAALSPSVDPQAVPGSLIEKGKGRAKERGMKVEVKKYKRIAPMPQNPEFYLDLMLANAALRSVNARLTSH
jgi:hypothetical protein